jgi:hypothetical protein
MGNPHEPLPARKGVFGRATSTPATHVRVPQSTYVNFFHYETIAVTFPHFSLIAAAENSAKDLQSLSISAEILEVNR